MGPRSIPKRHGKRQNFKAAAALTLGVFIPLNLNSIYTISIPISFRHPASRANWTKVMDLDGMNHQSKSNHPHQSATYSSNPGLYSSKVHVK